MQKYKKSNASESGRRCAHACVLLIECRLYSITATTASVKLIRLRKWTSERDRRKINLYGDLKWVCGSETKNYDMSETASETLRLIKLLIHYCFYLSAFIFTLCGNSYNICSKAIKDFTIYFRNPLTFWLIDKFLLKQPKCITFSANWWLFHTAHRYLS